MSGNILRRNLHISPQNSSSVTTLTPKILYKDTDVIVVNKPPGLLTHSVNMGNDESVASLFAHEINEVESQRAGIVHRLDKDTSGVMILARNTAAKTFLQKQFQERKVNKHYLALIDGHIKPEQARLELPLKRSSKQPQKMIVHSTGKPAVSEYKVLKYYSGHSYIDMHILTGRTHQIRAQLAYLGHSVTQDKLYGHFVANDLLKRQFLHAYSLGITLPDGENKVFQAPLAQDLQIYLETLS